MVNSFLHFIYLGGIQPYPLEAKGNFQEAKGKFQALVHSLHHVGSGVEIRFGSLCLYPYSHLPDSKY